MLRTCVGVVIGILAWLAVALAAGIILRALWPAYVSVEAALAFTLPMLIVRLAIAALATVAAGFVTACIAHSVSARLIPGLVLLGAFIPVHVTLWSRFPAWYHLWFLLSLVPLAYLGNSIARSMLQRHRTPAPA